MGRNMTAKPKNEMSFDELKLKEHEEFRTRPLSVLTLSVKDNNQVLINCRNNISPGEGIRLAFEYGARGSQGNVE